VAPAVCPTCGRPLDAHNRQVRFRLPDPVLRTDDQERAAGIWMTDADPNLAVMMQVPSVGCFVRCLLPVSLSGGYAVTFGVWLAVQPDDLKQAFDVWWRPEYSQLELEGHLANRLPAWDLLAVPAHATVDDTDAVPNIVASTDRRLSSLISDEWPHEKVLATLPALPS
jgi:hypothetical protein